MCGVELPWRYPGGCWISRFSPRNTWARDSDLGAIGEMSWSQGGGGSCSPLVGICVLSGTGLACCLGGASCAVCCQHWGDAGSCNQVSAVMGVLTNYALWLRNLWYFMGLDSSLQLQRLHLCLGNWDSTSHLLWHYRGLKQTYKTNKTRNKKWAPDKWWIQNRAIITRIMEYKHTHIPKQSKEKNLQEWLTSKGKQKYQPVKNRAIWSTNRKQN